MDNSTSELLYVAYKNLLLRNIDTGFLRQHISDADYYILDKMPKLLFEVLDAYWSKHSTGDFLDTFYKLNPHRSKDIEFSKEVFSRIRDYRDFKILLDNVGEEAFANDIPLLVNAFEKNDGASLLNSGNFKTLATNQKFMEAIYSSDKFSLTHFDLPAPTNDDLIKEILTKDPRSFSKLNSEQQAKKEYIILALENGLNKTPGIIEKEIYSFIPDSLKTDKEVAILSSKGGCVNQPLVAFTYEGVLGNLLEGIHKKPNYGKSGNLKIDEIPVEVYKNPSNILELFNWMTTAKENIGASYENYAIFYKTIKAIAKINPYIKEQVSKSGSNWNQGSLGEVKNGTRIFFSDYFQKIIPEMTNELKYYVMASELNKDLNRNEERTKRLKI